MTGGRHTARRGRCKSDVQDPPEAAMHQTCLCDVNRSMVSSPWCLSLVLPLEMFIHSEEMYLAGSSWTCLFWASLLTWARHWCFCTFTRTSEQWTTVLMMRSREDKAKDDLIKWCFLLITRRLFGYLTIILRNYFCDHEEGVCLIILWSHITNTLSWLSHVEGWWRQVTQSQRFKRSWIMWVENMDSAENPQTQNTQGVRRQPQCLSCHM